MGDLCLSSCGKQGKSKAYSISKINKDKNRHKSNVIYRAESSCGETYIGETKRNFAVRKVEHENKSHNSEPARHVAKRPIHTYTWNIACTEKTTFRWKNNERPANWLRETNPKQTSTFFHCETVPLGNNLIEQNQVVCKFPSCNTDDDRTVENVLVLKF